MFDPTQPIALPTSGRIDKRTSDLVGRLTVGQERSPVTLAEYQQIVRTDLAGLAQLCFLQWDRLVGSNAKLLRFDPDAGDYAKTRERVLLGLRAALPAYNPESKAAFFPFVAAACRFALWADLAELRRSFNTPPSGGTEELLGAREFEAARRLILDRQGRATHLDDIFTVSQSHGVRTSAIAAKLDISQMTLQRGIERIQELLRAAPTPGLEGSASLPHSPPAIDGTLPSAPNNAPQVPEEFRDLFVTTGAKVAKRIAFHPILREGALDRIQAGLRHAVTVASHRGLAGAERVTLAERAMRLALWAPGTGATSAPLKPAELLGERELHAMAERIQKDTNRDARMRQWKDIFLLRFLDGFTAEELAARFQSSAEAIQQRLYKIQGLVQKLAATPDTAQTPAPPRASAPLREAPSAAPASAKDRATQLLQEELSRARQRFTKPPEFAAKLGAIIPAAVKHATTLPGASALPPTERESYLRRAARLAPWAYRGRDAEIRPPSGDTLIGEGEVTRIREAIKRKEQGDSRLKDWLLTFDRYFLEGLPVPTIAASCKVSAPAMYMRIGNIRGFVDRICLESAGPSKATAPAPAPVESSRRTEPQSIQPNVSEPTVSPSADEPSLRETVASVIAQHQALMQEQREAFAAIRRADADRSEREERIKEEELAQLNQRIAEKLTEILALLSQLPESRRSPTGG